MSGVKKLAKKTGKFALKIGGAAFGGLFGGPIGAVAGYKAGDAVGDATLGSGGSGEDGEPGVPLLDNAQRQRDLADRMRRRRGILANIFGGTASSTAPAVGQKQLTGQ